MPHADDNNDGSDDADGRVDGDQDAIRLVYKDIVFQDVDPKSAEFQIFAGLEDLGAEEEDLGNISIALREGMVVVIFGPPPVLARLQSLPLVSIVLLGRLPSEIKVETCLKTRSEEQSTEKKNLSREYKAGDQVEVFSNSYGRWGRGTVLRVRGGIVTSEFELPEGGLARKDLPTSHSDIRLVLYQGRHAIRGVNRANRGIANRRQASPPARSQCAADENQKRELNNPSGAEIRQQRTRCRAERLRREKMAMQTLGARSIGHLLNRPVDSFQSAACKKPGWGPLAVQAGDLVWYPRAGVWRPCKVDAWTLEGFSLLTPENEKIIVKSSDCDLVYPATSQYQSDLLELDTIELDSSGLENALRVCFCNNQPYARLGCTTIFTNPYRVVSNHFEGDPIQSYAKLDPPLPPHAYSTAAMAYQKAVKLNSDQAIFIVGEPCSGKSCVMQHTLDFFGTVAAVGGTKTQILSQINSLLAPLLSIPCYTDDNSAVWLSTRACLSVYLLLDTHHQIYAAEVDVSVLESGRVSLRTAEATSFDAMYLAMQHESAQQWIAEDLEPAWLGTQKEDVEYDPNCSRFDTWASALASAGIQVTEMVRTVCAIILLGNIQYVKAPDTGHVVCGPPEAVAAAANAFGVDQVHFAEALRGPESGSSASQSSKLLREATEECYRRLVAAVVQAANRAIAGSEDAQHSCMISIVDLPAVLSGINAAHGSDALHVQWLADATQVGFLSGALAGRPGLSEHTDSGAECSSRSWENARHRPTPKLAWTTRALIRLLGWSSCKLIRELADTNLTLLRRDDGAAQEKAKDVCSAISGKGSVRPWLVCCLRPNEEASELLFSRRTVIRQIQRLRLLDIVNLLKDERLVIVWPVEAFCKQYGSIMPGGSLRGTTKSFFAQRLIDLVLGQTSPNVEATSILEKADVGEQKVAEARLTFEEFVDGLPTPTSPTDANGDTGVSLSAPDKNFCTHASDLLSEAGDGEDEAVRDDAPDRPQSVGSRSSRDSGSLLEKANCDEEVDELPPIMSRGSQAAASSSGEVAGDDTADEPANVDARCSQTSTSLQDQAVRAPLQSLEEFLDGFLTPTGDNLSADEEGVCVDKVDDEIMKDTSDDLGAASDVLSVEAPSRTKLTPTISVFDLVTGTGKLSASDRAQIFTKKLRAKVRSRHQQDALRKVEEAIVESKQRSWPQPPVRIADAFGIVGTESVYLSRELQQLMDWRLEQEKDRRQRAEDGDEVATREKDYAEKAEAAVPPMATVRRVSFLVGDFARRPTSQMMQPRRGSLEGMSEGEQRQELCRRLSSSDAVEQHMIQQGRREIVDEAIKLHEEEYANYTAEKTDFLGQVIREMVDVYKVSLSDRGDLEKQHKVSNMRVLDAKKESDHWRSEADRLWREVKALRRQMDSRSPFRSPSRGAF